MAAFFGSQRRGRQSSQAVLVGLQEVATGRKRTVKAGGEASDVCGDVWEDTRCGLVVVGYLKEKHIRSTMVQLNQCLFLITSGLSCRSVLGAWTACPSRLANLGDNTGLFPDCEASTEHLSPRVVLSGRVSGQSDRTQSDQIWVPERNKRR